MNLRPVHFVPASRRQSHTEDDSKNPGSKEKSSTEIYAEIVAVKDLNSIENQTVEYFECKICHENIPVDTKNEHLRSMAHQILRGDTRQKPTIYAIQPSNVGFQLLLKSGWQIGTGMGNEEQGRIYPVASSQKLDRTGIGSEFVRKRKLDHSIEDLQKDELEKKKPRTRKEMDEQDRNDRIHRQKMIAYMNEKTNN